MPTPPRSPGSAKLARLILAIFILAFAHAAIAANRYDPRLRFRTVSTPHFDIHFHQGEESDARRLGLIVEQVGDALASSLGRPDSRVQVILVGQDDLSNGWATPVPLNAIEITATVPPGDSVIGNTDDWLRLVFTHEYTHVVHLSRRRGWIGGLHGVFGRLPIVYPNLFLPTWQIEGLAVFEESARTGMGRLPAGDFREIIDTAATAGRFEPLDRSNGGLIDWPGGTAVYVYGGYFQQYLADRYGEASLRRLTDETARRIPYLGSRAYKKVFGRSLGALWTDFRNDVKARAHEQPDAATRLTHHGFVVEAPRFGRDERVYYSIVNPHGFPSLMSLSADRSRVHRVATRYLGNRLGVGRDVLVFDQLELVSNVALQSDLYAVAIDGGHVRRLTRNERAGDPDLSADGTTIVCTVQRADRRELATLRLAAAGGRSARPSTLISEPGVDYSSPRWSPDARSIAAERRRPGEQSEVVIVDRETRAVRVIAAAPGHRSVTPTWTPDGSHLLFASDRDGGPFRIFRFDLGDGTLERLERTGNGSARSPDISSDGSTLVFSGYTVDGQDLFSIDLKAAQWTAVGDFRLKADATESSKMAAESSNNASGFRLQADGLHAEGHPYAPLRTLAPRFWTPTAATDHGEVVIGAATGGSDVLGRHAYAANAAWSSSRARPDWLVAYAYDRWLPTLFADYSDDTDPFVSGELRTREANAGLLLPSRHVRWSQTLLAAFNTATDTIRCPACPIPIDVRTDRRSLRAGWDISSVKSYGYSISPEEGASVTTTAEFTRRALGSDANAGAATLDARAYRALLPRHAVLAARFAAATAWGDENVRRQFSLSGPGPQTSGFDFGSGAIALLRGFSEGDILGQHALVANVDYRIPLAYVQRGSGTVPVFLRSIHAAVFADAGRAWTGPFRAGDARFSAGAELSFDTVMGYALPVTVAGGVAWRHDPAGTSRRPVAFGRIGKAF